MEKTKNMYKPHEDYLRDKESNRGFNSIIDGKNFCDEPIHGSRDYGGTKFGFMVETNFIGWGNDTRFFSWNDFESRWIRNQLSGTAVGKVTSYWCVGTSNLTSFSDGVPDYLLIYDDINEKYYKRVWEYGVDIPQSEFKRKTGIRELSKGDLVIQEYELTEEEYMELIPEEYDFVPTFYFQIRRYVDSQQNYDATKLVNSMDFTLLFNGGRLYEHDHTIWVKIEDGKRVYGKQRYLPALTTTEPRRPVRKIDQLPILKTIQYKGATINIRVMRRLRGDDINPSDYNELIQLTGSSLYPFSGILKGMNPFNIWVDKNKTILSRYDAWKSMGTGRELTQNTICIFEVVEDGELEFPTIKSSLPTNDMVEWGCEQHIEIVKSHKELHYHSTKNEDARVVMMKNEIINGGKHRGDLIESICHLTDDELSRKDLLDDDNHELTENYLKRNWDWLISNIDGKILHSEWMLKQEDWNHIDQFFYKVGKDICPYHVLVVGDFASSSGKRKDLKEQLHERPPKHTTRIWMVGTDDFMNGNTNNFKILWEK